MSNITFQLLSDQVFLHMHKMILCLYNRKFIWQQCTLTLKQCLTQRAVYVSEFVLDFTFSFSFSRFG